RGAPASERSRDGPSHEVALRLLLPADLEVRGGEPRGDPAQAAPDDPAGRQARAARRAGDAAPRRVLRDLRRELAQPGLARVSPAALPRAGVRVRQGVRAPDGLA